MRCLLLSALRSLVPSPSHALLWNRMLSDSVCGLDVLTCVCCVRRSRRLDEWLFPASCRFAKHEPEPEARLAHSPCVRLDVAGGADADRLPCRAWCAGLDSKLRLRLEVCPPGFAFLTQLLICVLVCWVCARLCAWLHVFARFANMLRFVPLSQSHPHVSVCCIRPSDLLV